MAQNVVLGLGNNIDYEIIWDSRIIEQMIMKYNISCTELRTDVRIDSVRSLLISILGFLSTGEGGEFFVESPTIIEEFSSAFDKKVTMGGTSIRCAISMAKLGYSSAIHLVTINDHVRELMPSGCSWICSNDKDSLYPHLVIQFNENTVVDIGDIRIRAPRANRIIYDNDLDNIFLKLNPKLSSLTHDAKVFLISGFNIVHSETILTQRIETLGQVIGALPRDAWTLYEDGCFHKPVLSKFVHKELLGKVDIHSMNEEELQGYLGRKVDLMSPEAIYSALVALRQVSPVPFLVLHTRFWALVYGKQASRFHEAIKSGITMATTRFKRGDDFGKQDYLETEELPSEPITIAFSDKLNTLGGDEICCVPSLVVKDTNVTTVGLGDAFVAGFLLALIEINKNS